MEEDEVAVEPETVATAGGDMPPLEGDDDDASRMEEVD